MPITFAKCVAELRQRYSGCPDGMALSLVRSAYRELCDDYSIAVTRTTISLVAGVSRYDIPAEWSGVRSIAYLTDAEPESAIELLGEDDVEDRDKMGTLYRFERRGEPRIAMLDAGQIVIVPAPEVGTGMSGYPRLDVEASVAGEYGPNAFLPGAIRETDVIVNRAACKYAINKDHGAVELWMAIAEDSERRLERFAARRNRRRMPQSYPETYYQPVT